MAAVVIVDVYMPRKLGAQRLRAARKAYPDVPTIAVSTQFCPGVECSGPAAHVTVHNLAQKHIDRLERAFGLCGEDARIVGELPAIVFDREPIGAPLRVGYDGEVNNDRKNADHDHPSAQAFRPRGFCDRSAFL